MSKSQQKYMFNGSFINYADRESSNEWARDEIGTDFCVNLDNNSDNEFYCFIRKPRNHV